MNAVLVLVFTTPIVALTRRFKPIANVAFAGILYSLGFGVLMRTGAPWIFYFSTFLWTMGEIVQATNESVYVSNHTPMSHRARFNSVLPLISGLGFSLATPIAGRIAEVAGFQAVWALVAVVALLAAAGIWGLGLFERKAALDDGTRR
ncbi:MAG: MFS transporter, partial [Spirochaetales bacterium]|nr:MFS transporter [Spirochaetales bacterium]